jgi:hypothetical protein
MTEAVGTEKGERTAGYRPVYYGRMLGKGVGKLELRVQRERRRRFSTSPRSSIGKPIIVGARVSASRPGSPSNRSFPLARLTLGRVQQSNQAAATDFTLPRA